MPTKPPLSKRCVDTVAALRTYTGWALAVLTFCLAYTVGLAWWRLRRQRQGERKTAAGQTTKSSGGTNGEADPWRW
jgi:hypothetical protein